MYTSLLTRQPPTKNELKLKTVNIQYYLALHLIASRTSKRARLVVIHAIVNDNTGTLSGRNFSAYKSNKIKTFFCSVNKVQ